MTRVTLLTSLEALKSDAVVVAINYRLNLSLAKNNASSPFSESQMDILCVCRQNLLGEAKIGWCQAHTILRFGFLQPPVAETVPANRGGLSIYNCDYTDVSLTGGDRH